MARRSMLSGLKSELLCEFHCQRTRLSSLKSELLCDLHYSSNVVVDYFLVVVPSSESLEIPIVRFLVTCARETLINEWSISME
jgi:hypothetical protein